MFDFLLTYKIEISAAIISLIVTICTLIITHFLDYQKMIFAEKAKIVGELSKQKYEGIAKIRTEIEILSRYENLSLTEERDSLIPENVGKKIYTPAACFDYKSLSNISCKLNDLHSEYGHCLRHRSVIYLIYIRNFFFDYTVKWLETGYLDEELRWASVPIYNSIHHWYKIFDKELISSMNRVSTKYYAHSGIVYNFLLYFYGLYFKSSFPYKYLNDESSILNQMINQRDEIIANYEEEIVKNSDEI